MDSKANDEVSLADLFEKFVEATTMRNVLALHQKILDHAKLKPCEFNTFFPKYKRAITASRQKKAWKAKALFTKLDKRAAHKCYSNTKALATSSSDNKSCDTATSERQQQQQQQQQQQHEENGDGDSEIESLRFNPSNNHALQNYNCLVIGSGPAGLRTAIELQLLGSSRVVIVEKRGRFSRNNVLHLWPFVIDDLKSLGAKKFYGKFCAGSIDHISIRQLQLMLLKICLMLGCDFRDSCSYLDLCPATLENKTQVNKSVANDDLCDSTTDSCQPRSSVDKNNGSEGEVESSTKLEDPSIIHESSIDKRHRNIKLKGVRAHFECDQKIREDELHAIEWDIILGADGRRNTLSSFFPRMEFRGRLAIAITANFINRQTPAETSVPEISGLSFIYNQDMFNALAYDTNIQLENICYYKDDTHYFVMTAKKRSLLERGVLIEDYAATKDLLSDKNVDKAALLKYAKDAAYWTTGLQPLDFALNHYGEEDCAMFDFTSMYAASNACRALRTKAGGFALMGLVGDSLLEPFWPTGSGCARGFLSSFDAAWMCRQWAVNKCAVVDHHGTGSSLSKLSSSRTRNIDTDDLNKSPTQVATTYDRMALNVIAERESIYRILAQTTSENLQQNYSHWTLNPHTRYPNLNRHLVSPGQVEHLVASTTGERPFDGKLLSPKFGQNQRQQQTRRVKSPTNNAKSRRSPKKLKSAGASPMAQPRNANNQYKLTTSSRANYKSRSRNDVAIIDDYYLEFEQSYKDLEDNHKGGTTQYLNYKQRNLIDDIFIPSISGTLPSSNNLSKLEARKARDIDECLRQRRQKSKIHIVRDQLISRMRGEKAQNGTPIISGGNAVLFNEIRRMREQQCRGLRSDSKPRDAANGPLSLLNSMRRCASFAERVKSFESKLSNQSADTQDSTTPKTPIDNVKNLPQFATLQELIINNAQSEAHSAKKRQSRVPVTKLSKEDWNVKCWEKRLSAHKQTGLSLSSRSLNKSVSVDSGCSRPKLQLDIFQDRIKEMADKLDFSGGKENNQPPYREKSPRATATNSNFKRPQAPQTNSTSDGPVRSQGWINHLKRELSKGSEGNRRTVNGQAMNPALPSKPIKKLFDDEADDDDDGIDVNKHYDHLCVNRPTNKYLSKGSYTSHLARNKYSSITSRVINRTQPKVESKQAFLATLASRGSSASSTLSDYSSTNTGNSSSGSAGTKQPSTTIDVECFRCKKFVSSSDRITLGTTSLHRLCLTCGQCGLTLRTNEIQHYINVSSSDKEPQQVINFLCAICEPDIRADLTREADCRLAAMRDSNKQIQLDDARGVNDQDRGSSGCQPSREEFLSTKINYSELYKNIIGEESKKLDDGRHSSKLSPSPTRVTLSSNLITNLSKTTYSGDDDDDNSGGRRSSEFSISESQTVDGNEQVTVILPSREATTNEDVPTSSRQHRVSKESELIDEEELERILHLDNRQVSRKSSDASSFNSDGTREDEEEGSASAASSRRQREGSSVSSVSSLDQQTASDASSSVDVDDLSAAIDDHSSGLDIVTDSE